MYALYYYTVLIILSLLVSRIFKIQKPAAGIHQDKVPVGHIVILNRREPNLKSEQTNLICSPHLLSFTPHLPHLMLKLHSPASSACTGGECLYRRAEEWSNPWHCSQEDGFPNHFHASFSLMLIKGVGGAAVVRWCTAKRRLKRFERAS